MRATLTRKEDIIQELTEIAKRRFNGELNERGYIQKMAEELGEKYGCSLHTIKNIYRDVKKELYPKLEADKAFEQAKQSHKKEEVVKSEDPKQKTVVLPERKRYITGDYIDVIVERIMDYGAICVTDDIEKQQGLIHVSNIANSVIPDVGDYFTEGERIKNAIITGRKQEGNLKLSTLHLNLKPKNKNTLLEEKMRQAGITPRWSNHIDKAIEKIKETSKSELGSATMTAVAKQVESVEHEVKEALIEEVDAEIELEDKEMQKVMRYISKKVGAVSKRAQTEIKKMIDEEGIVEFMIAATEVMGDFETDISMALVNEVKAKMKECLWRR